MQKDDGSPAPLRALGPWSLTAISVNTVIGAGIFALPATVSQILGPSGPLAYVIAGVATLLIALCFAEAGSRFESSGGPYVYARAAFGEFFGFQAGWLFIVARVTAVAAVSNTFADYLGYFWPAMARGPGKLAAITFMIGTLAGVHLRGIRVGAAINNLFTIGKLVPLFVFCAAGVFLLNLPALPAALPAARPIQQGSLLLIFALGGFENASIPSEEVIQPSRTVPLALLASTSSVALLYFLIHIVAMAALPDLANSTTPLASAARNFLGPAGGLMLTVGAALSTAGSNHVNLLVGPRLLYAMGRAGTIPAQFAWLHPVYRAPSVSIVLYAATAWILAISSAFGPLAALSGLARLLIYTTTCLSTAVLRIRTPPPPGGFRLPGGILIPVLALGVCAWLLAGSTVAQVIIVTIAVVSGAALYALARRYTP